MAFGLGLAVGLTAAFTEIVAIRATAATPWKG
jgi:hypothetical protein